MIATFIPPYTKKNGLVFYVKTDTWPFIFRRYFSPDKEKSGCVMGPGQNRARTFWVFLIIPLPVCVTVTVTSQLYELVSAYKPIILCDMLGW